MKGGAKGGGANQPVEIKVWGGITCKFAPVYSVWPGCMYECIVDKSFKSC